MRIQKSIVLCCLMLVASEVLAQDLETVIDKYFEAVGGKETIEAVKTSFFRYQSFNYYPKKDTGLTLIKQKLPDYRIILSYDNGGKLKFQSILKRDSSYFIMTDPYVENFSFRTKSRVADEPPMGLLTLINLKSLNYFKADTLNGTPCQILRTKHSDKQPTLYYYFDNQTGLLFAQKWNENYTYYKDYRKVNELYVSFVHEQYLNKMLLDKTIYDSIALNVEFDANEFKIQTTEVPGLRKKNSRYDKVEFVDQRYAKGDLQTLVNSFHGKRLLIDLWASWCGPCKAEFAKYDDGLYDFFVEHNINVLFVSVDKPEKEKVWKKDLLWFNLNGYHLRADKKLWNSIAREIYHGEAFLIPRYVLIDENGKILSENLGKPSSTDFRTKVTKLLK